MLRNEDMAGQARGSDTDDQRSRRISLKHEYADYIDGEWRISAKRNLSRTFSSMECQRMVDREEEFEKYRRRTTGRALSTDSGVGPNQKTEDKSDQGSMKYSGDSSGRLVEVTVVVRRKDEEGNLPVIDEILNKNQIADQTALVIIDEVKLTHSSPNPYFAVHDSYLTSQTKAPKNLDEAFPLKIMTSSQESLSTQPSKDVHVTCFICGKSVPGKQLKDHEEKCKAKLDARNDWERSSVIIHPPPKPRGSITLEEWNKFALEASRQFRVTCSFCGESYLPDNPEETSAHSALCQPIRPFAPIEYSDDYEENTHPFRLTIRLADESMGKVTPTAEELQKLKYPQRVTADRVDEFSRPLMRQKPFMKKEDRMKKKKKSNLGRGIEKIGKGSKPELEGRRKCV